MEITSLYLKELKNLNSSQENTIELINAYRNNGDERAKEMLLKNYLLHVVKIARGFSTYGISINDLISEGNIGLLIAADKYDINNGSTFGSYSKTWIRQRIFRECIHKDRLIRLPENISDAILKGDCKDYRNISFDLEEFDLHINDKLFAETAAQKLIDLMK